MFCLSVGFSSDFTFEIQTFSAIDSAIFEESQVSIKTSIQIFFKSEIAFFEFSLILSEIQIIAKISVSLAKIIILDFCS
jgi:hypothetical protein